MSPGFVFALLVSLVSVPRPVQSPGAWAEVKAVKTRLDLRVEPLADLYQLVRTRAAEVPAPGGAQREDEPLPSFLRPAVSAARRIQEKLGAFPPAWGVLDGNLWNCSAPEELGRRFQVLPEELPLPRGKRVKIRAEAHPGAVPGPRIRRPGVVSSEEHHGEGRARGMSRVQGEALEAYFRAHQPWIQGYGHGRGMGSRGGAEHAGRVSRGRRMKED